MTIGCSYSIMTEEDIDTVLAIERAVFKHPWTKDFFHLIISDFNNYVITLKNKNALIGYGGYHLLKNKTNFLFSSKEFKQIIHLINIAIYPPHQHQGFGSFLINTLLSHARRRTAEYCYLEVRPSNQKAFLFYKKFGFLIIGMIENYYPHEQEDAFVMGKELKPAILGE